MYVNGHERDNVVEYRCGFVSHWKEYKCCFQKWDNDGIKLLWPDGFQVPGSRFQLIPVTHDESTFYQNDQRNTGWVHTSDKATPRPKGNGQLIMVSDFLTSEWGRLRDELDVDDGRVPFIPPCFL